MKASSDQWSTKSLEKFWNQVFDETEEMASIPTTLYFSQREKDIITKWFGNMKGKKIFKSDLWDEVKNTKLLFWAHKKGAKCYGIDISSKVLKAVKKEAKYVSAKYGDVRKIPYSDSYFDFIISIGTVEHFPDTIKALKEMRRILKPGGVAMISIPVKYDIWGRFIFIGFLQKLGLYNYGYEIQYRRSEFKNLLEKAGFKIEDKEGYLIFPSPLRAVDYLSHIKNFKLGNTIISKILNVFYKIETNSRFISYGGYMMAFKCGKGPK